MGISNFLPFVNICWQWIIKVAQAPALAEPTLIPRLGPSVMDLHIKPLTEGWIANIIICAAFFSPVEDELQLLPSISFFQVIFILQFPLTPKRVKNRSISFQFQTGRGKEPGERQRMPLPSLSTCLSAFLPTPPARSPFRARLVGSIDPSPESAAGCARTLTSSSPCQHQKYTASDLCKKKKKR